MKLIIENSVVEHTTVTGAIKEAVVLITGEKSPSIFDCYYIATQLLENDGTAVFKNHLIKVDKS